MGNSVWQGLISYPDTPRPPLCPAVALPAVRLFGGNGCLAETAEMAETDNGFNGFGQVSEKIIIFVRIWH